MSNLVKFSSNLAAVIAMVEAGEQKALDRVADAILKEAENNTPVDTGRLKASWVNERQGNERIIGNTAPYAGYVETGTSKTPARHMLAKAIENNRGKLAELTKGAWE
jgi:HK97 gp10 family phage protein